MFWSADSNGRLASMTDLAHVARGCIAGREPVLREAARPQVVAVVRDLLRSVLQSKLAGSTSCRISELGGLSARVTVEANPALSPDDRSFAGYIGSVRLVKDPTLEDAPVDEGFARVMMLDAIADHVVKARGLAIRADERQLMRVLDLALLSIGDRLSQVDGA